MTEHVLTNGSYCPALIGRLCWPQTLANHSVNISCAVLPFNGVDRSSSFA